MDSLSTSAGTEDHVSMGGFAARKALQVVRNVEKVPFYTKCDIVEKALASFAICYFNDSI